MREIPDVDLWLHMHMRNRGRLHPGGGVAFIVLGTLRKLVSSMGILGSKKTFTELGVLKLLLLPVVRTNNLSFYPKSSFLSPVLWLRSPVCYTNWRN